MYRNITEFWILCRILQGFYFLWTSIELGLSYSQPPCVMFFINYWRSFFSKCWKNLLHFLLCLVVCWLLCHFPVLYSKDANYFTVSHYQFKWSCEYVPANSYLSVFQITCLRSHSVIISINLFYRRCAQAIGYWNVFFPLFWPQLVTWDLCTWKHHICSIRVFKVLKMEQRTHKLQ